MSIRILTLLFSLALVGACSDGGSSSPTTNVTITQPDPTTPVNGGAVKGPLINADANLYLIDLGASDLKGELVSTGSTNNAAALQGLSIPAASSETFLLELIANDSTVDLNSNAAPILMRYQTIAGANDLRGGQIYATPITTMAITLAQRSGPFSSIDELNSALNGSARQVLATLGFGLDANTNPFLTNPLLTAADASDDAQRTVLAYRLAVEGVGAVLQNIATAAGANSSVDDILDAIANDLADGTIDGQAAGSAIDALTNVTNLGALVTADPATLMIPGTDRPLTEVANLLVAETSTTGAVVETQAITSGAVTVTPVAAVTEPDIDGDGVADVRDAFPNDPEETIDTDGDGTGNNSDLDDDGDGTEDIADAFPLNRDEQLDTDGDGIGNNADEDDDGDGVTDGDDALPLVATESVDTDGDGIGNNADEDDDGDGTPDVSDAFPLLSSEQVDTDLDGIGNNKDSDDDNDGVADAVDNLPLDARASVASSATIGPAGGSLTSPDGNMTLTFPANALSTDTVISIGAPVQSATDEFSSDAFPIEGHYLLEPDGTQFAEPVEMVWQVPDSSNQPNAIRLIYTRSQGVNDAPDEPVVTNPETGTVTASITHFSDLFVVTATGVLGINQPTAGRGETLTWTYSFELQDNDYSGFFRTEGAFLLDEDANTAGITRQPELLSGDAVISAPEHDQVVNCKFLFDESDDDLTFECAPSTTGTITATCLDSSAEGLTARMGFNFEFNPNFSGLNLFPEARTRYRVEANATCIDSVEITEPQFIAIGNDVDRITETPERIIIDECSPTPANYYVVVSNTRTSVLNQSGSCSRDLNFTASDNSVFGAQVLTNGDESRLFQYGESGVFIVELEDGVFGQLDDFQSTTTDIQLAVDDTGTPISNQAFSVTNSGAVRLRTLNSDGTNAEEDPFSAFALTGTSFIGYSPISSTSGVGITTGSNSEAFYVFHGDGGPSATSIGSVGDTALGVSCSRLSCDSGSTACALDDTPVTGCAVTAFNSEELYKFYLSGDLNLGTVPTLNSTVPIAGIKTASPFVKSNQNGQLVTATVNDNEVGKIRLELSNPDGSVVQTAELFLQTFTDDIGFLGNGSSIVLIEPSAEFPNGAVRVSVRQTDGEGDGVLTIPVTEALLETSPEPFFGPAFSE